MITNTTRLRLRIRDKLHCFLDQRDPLVVLSWLLVVPLILAIISTAIYRSATAPAVAAQPTPQLPIILIATAPAVVVPTAAPIQVAAQPPNTLRRAVVAYDAPNGSALGAIEQGRAYRVAARFGADWLQADVVGSGVVWLKADQVLDLPADLADLQPTPAPQIVYQVVNQPAYQPPAAPVEAVPTPEPTYQVMSALDPQPSERQRNIQDRLVDPSVAQAWAQQQWRDEHCIADKCIP